MAPAQRRRPRAEHGFTIVEILVAMLVLTVGILAMLGSLISAGTLTLGSQAHEAAIGFAEQQIELLRQQPFASLGMTAPLPAPSSNVNDPNYYTRSAPACYDIQVNYQAGGSSLGCESFVAGGTVPSATQPISGYQGLSGSYNVYVTQHFEAPPNNGCVTISASQVCLTGAEKRITVAVLPAAQPGTGSRKPIWVTSIISDPNTPLLTLP